MKAAVTLFMLVAILSPVCVHGNPNKPPPEYLDRVIDWFHARNLDEPLVVSVLIAGFYLLLALFGCGVYCAVQCVTWSAPVAKSSDHDHTEAEMAAHAAVKGAGVNEDEEAEDEDDSATGQAISEMILHEDDPDDEDYVDGEENGEEVDDENQQGEAANDAGEEGEGGEQEDAADGEEGQPQEDGGEEDDEDENEEEGEEGEDENDPDYEEKSKTVKDAEGDHLDTEDAYELPPGSPQPTRRLGAGVLTRSSDHGVDKKH